MSEVVTNVELTTGEMKYLIDSMWGTLVMIHKHTPSVTRSMKWHLKKNYSAMLHRRSMN